MKKYATKSQSSAQLGAENTVAIIGHLSDQFAGSGEVVSDAVARKALSMEGYDDADVDVSNAVSSLESMITTALSQVTSGREKGVFTASQEEAAVVAGLAASARKHYGLRTVDNTAVSAFAQQMNSNPNGSLTFHVPSSVESAPRRASLEAFDNRVNVNTLNYSVAYNLGASRQNEFGEAFYPTVVVTPESVGFNVNVRVLYVYDEVIRQTNASLNNFNRKNLIRAIIDATILKDQATKLIPVYRKSTPANAATDNDYIFSTVYTPVTLQVDNQPLTTAPYAAGAKFSIIGACQTNAMVAQSLADQTDAVDSSAYLDAIYVKLTGTVNSATVTELIRVPVRQLPTAAFNAAPQGNTRKLQLNFDTSAILLTSGMTTTNGTASQLLAALTTNSVRLSVTAFGSIVQDTADTQVNFNVPSISAINDANGNALSASGSPGSTIAAVFTGAVIDSYDLEAYRTNSDRRNRGKLLDIQNINYLYTVPLLPPITALRPVADSEANDGNLVANLVSATRTQLNNASVTALLEAQSFLSSYASAPDVITNQPQLFGAAAQLVTPAYLTYTLNATTQIDSLSTAQRAMDLQNLLFNKLRDMATILYVNSGYAAALEAMYEGAPPKTVVIIGTDPYLYRYLTLTGDTRLMGDMFEYKIVHTLDSRMQGKILFSFGNESSFNSNVPNPLHFGNLGWKTELTIMLPMVRNGANVMELTVQPSYRHVTNLPIMGQLIVTGVTDIIAGKVAINNHPV